MSDESALTMLAALAGVGIRYYSRRLRKSKSRVRFPAYSAGRRLAEHSGDAQVVLVTTSTQLAQDIIEELDRQMQRLGRESTLRTSIPHSRIIAVDSLEQAFEVSNTYAPEHLIVQVENARAWLPKIRNAGSVFLGAWTPESMGDYCSGTNHVLPTYGFARRYSSLGVGDFLRSMTIQELTVEGLENIGPIATTLAELEGLDAHASAVSLRLNAAAGARR